MTTYQAIVDFRSDYLDTMTNALKANMDSMHMSVDLGMKVAREHALYPYDWTLAMVRGESPKQAIDVLDDSLRASSHMLADHYARMVKLLESHLHVATKSAHRSLDQIQYWAPRGIEGALGHLDYMVDAAESSTDKLADATVELVRSMDQQLDASA